MQTRVDGDIPPKTAKSSFPSPLKSPFTIEVMNQKYLSWTKSTKVGLATGLVISKKARNEVPPPGVGFVTVIDAVPALARKPGSARAALLQRPAERIVTTRSTGETKSDEDFMALTAEKVRRPVSWATETDAEVTPRF
jgi:hypothetical protein